MAMRQSCDTTKIKKPGQADNMKIQQIAGIALLIAGILLLFFGWQSSQSIGEQLVETITGRFTDNTMWYFIVGAVTSVVGVCLLAIKK
jgi:succinate dehydrogenase/fumarate reductase cytochrome b subunit